MKSLRKSTALALAYLLLLLLSPMQPTHAAHAAEPSEVEWQKTFGGTSEEGFRSVQQTSDGGYVAGGWRSGSSGLLVRTTSSGELVWEKNIGGEIYSVREADGGGYILAGSSGDPSSRDGFLIKVDDSGNTIWVKYFGGADDDILYSCEKTSDGGYVLGGYKSIGISGSAWLIKVDAAGNLQWERTYGGDSADAAYSVLQTQDDGYVLAGQTYSAGAGNWDAWLIKTDASGNSLWDKTFGGPSEDGAWNVINTLDGGFAIAGYTSVSEPYQLDAWLIKTDASGNMAWDKTFGTETDDFAYRVLQTPDGGYLLNCDYHYGNPGYLYGDAQLVRTDTTGTALWELTMGGPNDDQMYDVQRTADGGYVLAGDTWSDGQADAWLVKLGGGSTPPVPINVTYTQRAQSVTFSATSNGNPVSGVEIRLFPQGASARKQVTGPDGQATFYYVNPYGATWQAYYQGNLVASGTLTQLSSDSQKLQAALDEYKEAILRRVGNEQEWAVNIWDMAAWSLRQTGTNWAGASAAWFAAAKDLIGKDLNDLDDTTEFLIEQWLDTQGVSRLSIALSIISFARDFPEQRKKLQAIDTERSVWMNLADRSVFRSYLENNQPIHCNTGFKVARTHNVVSGVKSVEEAIGRQFSSLYVPASLPAGFPLDYVLSNLAKQTATIGALPGYSPYVKVNWPLMQGGKTVTGRETVCWMLFKEDTLDAMSRGVFWGNTVLSQIAFASMLNSVGSTCLGIAAGMSAGSFDIGFEVATTVYGTLEGHIQRKLQYKQNMSYANEFAREMEGTKNALAQDVGSIWAISQDTLGYINHFMSTGGTTSLEASAREKSLAASSVNSGFYTISADVSDIQLASEETMGSGTVRATISSSDTEQHSFRLNCAVLGKAFEGIKPVGGAESKDITVPAGGQVETDLAIYVPKSSLSDVGGAELVVWADSSGEDSPQEATVGPALAHVHTGTQEELQSYASQSWSKLLEDNVLDGDRRQATLNLPQDTRMARVFLPESYPYEFDMEIEDSQSRSIRYDSQTKKTVVDIPGATADLGSSYKFAELPGGDTYTVTVTGAQIPDTSRLVVSCLKFPKAKGAIALLGGVENTVKPVDGKAEMGTSLRELSGCSTVNSLTASVTDLAGSNGTIPSQDVVTECPQEIEAGGQQPVKVTVNLPQGVADGEYAGTLTVEGTELGSGTKVSAQAEIKLAVDTASPGKPTLASPVLSEGCITLFGKADGDCSVNLYQNGQLTASCVPNEEGDYSVRVLPDGTRNTFYAQAEDAAGNLSEKSGEVHLAMPPKMDSVSPTSGLLGTTVTIKGSSFGSSRGSSYVFFNGKKATSYASWTDTEIRVKVPTEATTGQVKVTTTGGTSNGKTFTVAEPKREASSGSTWYLAEGSTDWGFSTYITIANPNSSEANAKVTYMPTGSANVVKNVPLPPNSQTTVNPAEVLGQKDFSTEVECTEGKTIAVDRTMSWNAGSGEEAHSSVGVTSPAKTWYLPEGSSDWGFETWLLIQNPNASKATCTITYMIENEAPVTKTKTVGANARMSYNMFEDIGAKNASIKVDSSVPVIPERAMYRNNRREGHDSIGTTSPATDYFLAEGTSSWGFTTYVLVQNPNTTPANVTVTYMASDGAKPQAPFPMEANSRKTIRVNDVLPNTDFSTQVHADKPIIAERAMYWGEGTPAGEACHDSIGMSMAHKTFYLPDGQSSDGRETYTLIQNPNTTDVTVDITYMTPDGKGNVVKTETIPANSRRTFNMLEHSGINGRAAIMVECLTAGKKIMVERAMYWNNRGAGTDTIGGYADN